MKNLVLLTILSFLLFLAACSASANAAICPIPSEATLLLDNQAHGYCLLYPKTYTILQPTEDETVIIIDSLLNTTQPAVYIQVSDAAGQTTETAVEALLKGYEGFDIVRSDVQLGKETAVQLDNMPGQDLNRQLLIVHHDRLYRFTFTPMKSGDPAVDNGLEFLYATIINSLTFK